VSSSTGGGFGQGSSASGPGQGGYDPGAPQGYPPPTGPSGYPQAMPGTGYPQETPVGGYTEGGYTEGAYAGGYTEGAYAGGYTEGASAGGASSSDARYTESSYSGGATAASAGHPDVEDESVGSLVGRLTGDLSKLMRQELDLAKAEMREEAKKAGKAAGFLGGAGLAGLMVAILASFTLIWVLDEQIPLWLAALIVTLLWAILGAVLFMMGKKQLAEVNPKPEQTIESLKEDKQWVQAQKN